MGRIVIAMIYILIFLLVWLFLSIPLGMIVGRWIATNNPGEE